MTQAEPTTDAQSARGLRAVLLWPQSWIFRIAYIVFAVLLLSILIIWISREDIAGNLIDDALEQNGLNASYEIVSIGPKQQVLRNLVIGSSEAPNFTAERVVVDIAYTLGRPGIGRVELQKPRLYGSFLQGTLSFGALDPVIFAESDEPPGLPALDIILADGRARIDSDFGTLAAKLDGKGQLDDGFEGVLAVTAPGLGNDECSADQATIYGAIATRDGTANFDGPIRLGDVSCAGARLAKADVGAKLTLSGDFASLEGTLIPAAEDMSFADFFLADLTGETGFALGLRDDQEGNLTLRHELTGRGFAAASMMLDELAMDGALRASDGFAKLDWEIDAEGTSASFDFDESGALDEARASLEGTLAQGLLAKLERGLSSALTDGQLSAKATLRVDDGVTNIIAPDARLRAANGETVLALSRVSYSSRGDRLVGNILTGGQDIPQITGRMQQAADDDFVLRLSMQEYREGSDWLSVPRLSLRQSRSGIYSFDGIVRAGGSLPGGSIRGVELPLEGRYDASRGLAIGMSCTSVRLAGLSLSQLDLEDRTITLCPLNGQAIASYDGAFQLSAQTQGLELAGELAGTKTNVTATDVVIRYPGPFEIASLDAIIGPDDNALRLSASTLSGEFSERIGGRFDGARASIDAVPLDLSGLGANWTYENGVLSIGDGAFTLSERPSIDTETLPRFNPLSAQGAVLTLEDNVVRANADLQHPATGTLVTRVEVRHDLSDAIGSADLDVPGIRFSENLQPDELSELITGFVALAEGTITGEGRVDWTADTIDSSGIFRTEGFDFAAAFGPVRGVSGEIAFTDLLSLTTAPEQKVTIASVNPGIEALGGEVIFSLTEGTTLTVHNGRWPFMGGELILRPTTAVFGGSEGQSYVFEMIALDAATFVAQMELSNIGATGTFDGTVPIFFDPTGDGFIRGGLLISRAPGGNVAYVGDLTYADLGAISNYAFQSLRSLDYNQMSIELNGSLAGEIVTNFQIDGVRQGEGTNRNFVTQELAKLPIRFKINVRSDNFFTLAKIARGLFDPTIFANDFDQELLGIEALERIPLNPEPLSDTINYDADRRDEPAVQRSESDGLQ